MRRTYFAAEPPYSKDFAAAVMARIDTFYRSLWQLAPYHRARKARQHYYGLPSDASPFDVSAVAQAGQSGELTQVRVNRFHMLGQRVLTLAVRDDWGWQPVAANGDTKSRHEAMLASSVLDYEKRTNGLRQVLNNAAEYALLDSHVWVSMEWDPRGGALVDVDPQTGAPYYEGALRVAVRPWFRCPVALDKQDATHDWIVIQTPVNKWDLVATYCGTPEQLERMEPEARAAAEKLRDSILGQAHEHTLLIEHFHRQAEARGTQFIVPDDQRDQIPLYTFFHKPTPSCPKGRVAKLLGDGRTVLLDGASPYGAQLPVIRVAPGEMLDTPWGSTPMSDLISMQEVLDTLWSSITTNQVNGALTNLVVPQGANLVQQVLNGATIWEVADMAQRPEVLNFAQSSPETYRMLSMTEAAMDALVGLNAVALGQPLPNLSGAAMALLDSKSLQSATVFIGALRSAVEQLGTRIVEFYQQFARAPRRLEVLAGKGRRYMVEDFVGQQIGSVARVTVEARSSLLDTSAGRMDMAEKLLASGAISGPNAPRAILDVYRTGTLDPALLPDETESNLISAENELLQEGQVPPVHDTDDHALHAERHRAVLANPEARMDAALVERVNLHLAQHAASARTAPPDVLALLGRQPLPPLGMDPAAGPAPELEQGPLAEGLAPPPVGQPPQPNLPNLPRMPINPATGEPAA